MTSASNGQKWTVIPLQGMNALEIQLGILSSELHCLLTLYREHVTRQQIVQHACRFNTADFMHHIVGIKWVYMQESGNGLERIRQILYGMADELKQLKDLAMTRGGMKATSENIDMNGWKTADVHRVTDDCDHLFNFFASKPEYSDMRYVLGGAFHNDIQRAHSAVMRSAAGSSSNAQLSCALCRKPVWGF